MIPMEIKSLIDNRKNSFEQLLNQNFEQIDVNNETCFKVPSGEIITVTPLYSAGAIVIEYAEDLSGAKMNAYEDGDLFYVNETAEHEMFQMMLHEINQLIL